MQSEKFNNKPSQNLPPIIPPAVVPPAVDPPAVDPPAVVPPAVVPPTVDPPVNDDTTTKDDTANDDTTTKDDTTDDECKISNYSCGPPVEIPKCKPTAIPITLELAPIVSLLVNKPKICVKNKAVCKPCFFLNQ